VDEYPDDGEYTIAPEVSVGPLTLAELIDLLDGATYTGGDLEGGLALGWNNNSLDSGETSPELRNFTSLESGLYPELSAHYERVFDDWEQEHSKALEGDAGRTQ
jgi:hypothetical protein